MRDELQMADDLLAWYDANARELPWRMPPLRSRAGELPDPYHVWLSEIMLQQTGVVTVREYFLRFLARWPDVAALAAAPDSEVMEEWAGLGYYARARNLLKCARVVASEMAGEFPRSEAELLRLPGIGPYTAAAIASIAFGARAVVVDGNVERVMARVRRIETPLPAAKPEIRAVMEQHTPRERSGDFAQAVMDLGATICTPRNPKCLLCPIETHCVAYRDGVQESLPRKEKKKPKPTRFGIVYVARRDGEVLLERRPDKGLLGGMLGFPGGDWGEAAQEKPPVEAMWREMPGEVRHTFTHFHLRLRVMVGEVPPGLAPDVGAFQPPPPDSALPTVMRKVWRAALTHN